MSSCANKAPENGATSVVATTEKSALFISASRMAICYFLQVLMLIESYQDNFSSCRYSPQPGCEASSPIFLGG